jgi:hypothetical protein
MSNSKALISLGREIARVHGWPAAKAFKSYRPSDRDRAMIAAKAAEMLKLLTPAAAAAAEMSAAFVVHLERDLDAPAYMVTGELRLMGEPLSPPNGHAWLMIGSNVADIALFRMAYSRTAPSNLAQHAYQMFGPDQGLLFAPWSDTRKVGFDYIPHRVLSDEEIDSLLVSARELIGARP